MNDMKYFSPKFETKAVYTGLILVGMYLFYILFLVRF